MTAACKICGEFVKTRTVVIGKHAEGLRWRELGGEMAGHMMARHPEIAARIMALSSMFSHWLASLMFESADAKFETRQETAKQTCLDLLNGVAAEVARDLRLGPVADRPCPSQDVKLAS
jgi:hypothetical protein